MHFVNFDPFGAYSAGREAAIDRNWNDRNQYNRVVAGALANDRSRLDNWLREDTYQDNLMRSNAAGHIAQNQMIGSNLNTTLALLGQPGAEQMARLGSNYQDALARGLNGTIPAVVNGQVQRTLGQAADAGAMGGALQRYAYPTREAQASNTLSTVSNSNIQQQAISPYIADEAIAQRQAAINYYNALNGQVQAGQQPMQQSMQQPMQGATQQQVSPMSAVYAQGARIPVGQEMTLNINGTAQVVGRDTQGVYISTPQGRQYVSAPQQQATQNPVFQW